MANRVRQPGSKRPRHRVPPDRDAAGFFPNEVVALMQLPQIDYAQLRFFYRIIRDPSGTAPPGRGWSRFSITDMAALVMALQTCGTADALTRGRRLTKTGLADAVAALHRQGFRYPLLEVGLERIGRRVVASIGGVLIDPVSGQQLLTAVIPQDNWYLVWLSEFEPDLSTTLEAEIRQFRSQR